ncbi:MAG: MoxR family ATPase [Thermoguttaceae bacterium]|nr:MoxR family ATPase [Thermoguttaceae bacterium]
MSNEELKEKLNRVREKALALEEEIGKVLVGQRQVVRETIVAAIAGGNVLYEGLPGLGKTLLVRAFAQTVGGTFSRIQFTPDLTPADVTGTNILLENELGKKYFEFQKGPIFANVVLADEINRATPKTQSALLEAMQEHSVTVGGVTRQLEGMFFILATQNPLEMEGTYPLPEAQLDRFFCKISTPYPTNDEMFDIVRLAATRDTTSLRQVVTPEEVLEMGRLANSIPMADDLISLVVRVVKNTRPEEATAPESIRKFARYGASPRAALSLASAAKIIAALDGRYNVAAKNVKQAAPSILRHRIVLNFEGQAENVSTDDLVADVLRGEKF